MGNTIQAKSYIRDNNLVTREIAGEAIIVPIRNHVSDLSCIYTLNPVAAFIWQNIDGRSSFHDLVNKVTGSFDVTSEQAELDINELLGVMETAGLIHSGEMETE